MNKKKAKKLLEYFDILIISVLANVGMIFLMVGLSKLDIWFAIIYSNVMSTSIAMWVRERK